MTGGSSRPDGGDDPATTAGDAGHAERPLPDLLAALASTLRATEELPVDPTASVWLGEAHAVAADLARGPVDRSVVHERVGHVRDLLAEADDPGNDAAADHVAEAAALAARIAERTAAADAAESDAGGAGEGDA
jgi:hypothetical protein